MMGLLACQGRGRKWLHKFIRSKGLFTHTAMGTHLIWQFRYSEELRMHLHSSGVPPHGKPKFRMLVTPCFHVIEELPEI